MTDRQGSERAILGTLGVMFLFQAVAGQFVFQGIPAFLRQAGQPASVIGLIFLAGLPYILRVLWAPLLDAWGSRRLGHRRSWILPAQAVAACVLGALLLADPAQAAIPIVAIAAVLMIVIGTQASASSAYMLEALPQSARAAGASVQARAAAVAGLVLGGGVLYLFADHGWQPTIGVMTAIAGAGAVLLCFLPLDRGHAPTAPRVAPLASFAMFRRPPVRRLLLVLLVIETGLALTYGMKPILQIDAGFSVAETGLIGVVGGNILGFAGAWAARPVVDRLGGIRAIALVGVLGVVVNGALALSLGAKPTQTEAVLFVLGSNFCTFAYFTASRSLIMAVCDAGKAATELTTFVSLGAGLNLALAAAGTALLRPLGPSGLFLLAALIAAAGTAIALLRLRVDARSPSPT